MRRSALVMAVVLAAAGCAPARFQAVAAESRAAEAESVLKQAHTLQETYRAVNGRYADTFAELERVGWEAPPGLRQYNPARIAHASGDRYCVEMLPLRDDVWPQHVDQSGQAQRGPCP
jgi:type II secretory pathway pseudopilin PulG